MSAYYDYAEDTVRTWLQEPIQLSDEGRLRVAQLVHETPQQRHWWPTFPNRRSQAMFSAPRLVVAGVTIAIISGSLLIAPGLLHAPVVTAPAVRRRHPRHQRGRMRRPRPWTYQTRRTAERSRRHG